MRKETLEELENALAEFYDEENMPTVQDVFKQLNVINRASGTIDDYQKTQNRYFSGINAYPLRDINSAFLKDFIKTQVIDKKMDTKQYKKMKTCLNKICYYANDIYSINFYEDLSQVYRELSIWLKDHLRIPRSELKKVDEEIFFPEEKRKIIAECLNRGDIVSLGLALNFFLGMRIGELAALPKNEVFPECRAAFYIA